MHRPRPSTSAETRPGAYIGRFAPSPTGPLHLGSLTTAIASYLHARQNHGEWLLRIENIDPPRETPGAGDYIVRTLEAFDLLWDRKIAWQHERRAVFEAAAAKLLHDGCAFHCRCSRKDIRDLTGGKRYPGTCREKNISSTNTAIRVIAPSAPITFRDALQGPTVHDIAATEGDYIIYRRDALPAYHLAVVLDDADQSITDVVRGIDLLDQTAIHLHLQRLLGLPSPTYWHMPVVVSASGEKLSKQFGASAINLLEAPRIAVQALALLGLDVPATLVGERPAVIWEWALEEWTIDRHRGQRSIAVLGD